jgi:hypothetical protein
MSALNEKSVVVTTSAVGEPTTPINPNVLTITRPSATRQQSGTTIDVLSTIEDCDSARSMSPPQSAHREKSPVERETSPYSFMQKSESKQNINSGFDTDIEALAHQKTEAGCSKTGLVLMKSKCQSSSNAWPNRTEQKRMMKAKKRDNACCSCWAGMSRRNRNIIRACILLLLIGLIIGLCLGVTRAVHGGVFHPN